MILNTHLPIKAWLDPLTARLPGVGRVAIDNWLTQSDTYAAQITYRRELMAAKRETVFQTTPEAEAACAELRDIICTEGGHLKSDAEHPLIDAASHVQEDICILQKRGEGIA